MANKSTDRTELVCEKEMIIHDDGDIYYRWHD
jgi:hypothetical protein